MIETSSAGALTTVVMNRPDKRNALHREMIASLGQAVTDAADAGSRAIILTGSGSAFSAGADLSEGITDPAFLTELRATLHVMESVPVPIIAAVNGAALGAGLQLAMAADVRVMAPGAFCGIPAAKIGVAVDEWTIRRLISLVGAGFARGILIGCDTLDAETAHRTGFANRIGDVAVAREWAEQIATFAPLTLAHYKLVITDDGSREEPPSHVEAMMRAWRSGDAQEAKAARSEKRQPIFRGV